MNFYEELEARGLVYQITDEAIKEKINAGGLTLYVGFDPTADSLHIGHLLPILMLKRFQDHGHHPLALVGGATGMIGDPSFKDAERQLNDASIVETWSNSIRQQLSQWLDFDAASEYKAEVVNNYDWLGNITLIEFLRDVGKNFTINYMMNKESVKRRVETGISYTEFAYQLLQAYDFLKLYEEKQCMLQLGGSDQWGNITSGIELVRKEHGETVYGLTMPLITKSDGTKFGKTEGNAVWLDAKKTTPYEFYQFWINTDDRDVIRFLKYFTFISLEEIDQLALSVQHHPEQREAQKVLAQHMTELVHGKEAYEQALHISKALFSGDLSTLTVSEIEQGFKDVPHSVIAKEDISTLLDLLMISHIASSKRQAREDITNGAIYVNGTRIQDLEYHLKDADIIGDRYIIIRRGKKKYHLIELQ